MAAVMDIREQRNQPNTRERLLAYWRRRSIFFVVAVIASILAILLAVLLPATYQSSATILIEQQEIPQDLVRSVITSFADQRIQVITQRVMTTQNLLQLIDRYHLYPDIRDKEPREVLLKKMRDDIGMHMISADVIDPRNGRPTQATIAFAVSYQSRSPDLALKVANELTTLYLNENLTSRIRLGDQTAEFFGEEVTRQAAHIAELDKNLAAFKEKHHDELPDLLQMNIQAAQRTDLDLRDAQNQVSALDSQNIMLQAELAQISPNAQVYKDNGQRVFGPEDRLKDLKSQLASDKARYGPDHPDVITAEREVAGLEKEVNPEDGTADRLRQLTDAKAKLAVDLQKYSPEYPDVVHLQHEVDSLQKAVDADAKAGTKDIERAHADNPAYIQVKGQLDALSTQREAAVKRRDSLQAKLDEYDNRTAKSPEVERQYRELARQLDSAQIQYQTILAKQTEAQVSRNLEADRKGEKFTLIEPPLPPEKPISPNRKLIVAVGLLMSLALGVAAVIARESFDGSVRGPADVRQLFDVPPLASIPVIVTAGDRKRRRRIVRFSWGGGVAAVLLSTAMVHLFVRPLDVVWQVLLRRFGI
jgi:succinoglycan biosynthesis transport protein ExoP